MKPSNRKSLFLAMAGLLVTITAMSQTPQRWWGYWTSDMPMNPVGELASGKNEMCIRLTSQNKKAVGAKLHGIRFYISNKTAVQSAKVWASSRQSAGYNLMAKDIPVDELLDVDNDGKPTTVMLDEPIDLVQANNPYSNIYIGFTIFLPEYGAFTPCEMMATGSSTGQMNANMYAWKTVEDSTGPIALQLLISNPDIPELGVTALIPEGLILENNGNFTVDIPIRNDGTEGVHSITYQWTIDETASWETEYVFENPVVELDAAPSIPVVITPPTEAAWHELGLNILSINGKVGGSVAEKKPLLVVEQYGTKRTVMEEFTGTWCPNCPRGTVGVNKLVGIFGERFIPIAVHNDDPMTIADYDQSKFRKSVTSALGGFPSATVDRTYNCDPYMGYTLRYNFLTDQIVSEALEKKAVADIDVEASWDDPTSTNINVRARTTYYYSSDLASHKLILVLTADGLTGDSGNWLQVNEFVGRTDLPEDMSPYVNGERRMKEIYNHVAVAVAGVENGISGSITSPVVCGETQEYQQQLTFPESLRQEGMQLYAVAMLVDNNTGQVMNANIAKVEQENTGITTPEHLSANAQHATSVYDLQGRKISQMKKGIYIMDGKKVVVTH
mgnify:CR=1 FL=1